MSDFSTLVNQGDYAVNPHAFADYDIVAAAPSAASASYANNVLADDSLQRMASYQSMGQGGGIGM